MRISDWSSDVCSSDLQVRAGDLKVRVPEGPEGDEIASLSRAFNRMTNDLATNRQELLEANQQLDRRRRFTETVLAGVSAGVIGLDEKGRINLPNRSASELLGIELDEMTGRPLAEVVPEMGQLVQSVRNVRRSEERRGGEEGVRTGR